MGLPHIRTLVVREKTVKETAKKRFKASPQKTAGKNTEPATQATQAGEATEATNPDWEGVRQKGEDPVSYFLGTRLPGPAEPLARLIRGHWGGSEIRNHGTRDVQWEEDKTRSGNWALNASLAILRVALISLKMRQEIGLSWPCLFEQCSHSTVSAWSLTNSKSSK